MWTLEEMHIKYYLLILQVSTYEQHIATMLAI